jgi:hypothetical protein
MTLNISSFVCNLISGTAPRSFQTITVKPDLRYVTPPIEENNDSCLKQDQGRYFLSHGVTIKQCLPRLLDLTSINVDHIRELEDDGSHWDVHGVLSILWNVLGPKLSYRRR